MRAGSASARPTTRSTRSTRSSALEPFLGKWVPVPFLRLLPGPRTFGRGLFDRRADQLGARAGQNRCARRERPATPIAWCSRSTPSSPPGSGQPYLVPALAETEDERELPLRRRARGHAWFLACAGPGERAGLDPQEWVDDWLTGCSWSSARRSGRAGRAGSRNCRASSSTGRAISPSWPCSTTRSRRAGQAHRYRLGQPLRAGQGRPRDRRRQQPDLRHPDRELPRPARVDINQLPPRAARPHPPRARLLRAVREPGRVRQAFFGKEQFARRAGRGRCLLVAEPGAHRAEALARRDPKAPRAPAASRAPSAISGTTAVPALDQERGYPSPHQEKPVHSGARYVNDQGDVVSR